MIIELVTSVLIFITKLVCRETEMQNATHLKLEVLDGVTHADGQGPTLHQKLDGTIQLLCQVP